MSAIGELLNRAAAAPEGVSYLDDAEGNVATIDRDPAHPGALRVEVRRAGDDRPTLEHVVVPPTDARPELMPADVPFFPGLYCTVVRRGDLLNIGWRDSAGVERSMPDRLRAELGRRVQDPPKGGEVSLLSVAEDLGDPAAVEWVRARERPTSPGDAFVEMFEALVSAYVGEGWEPEDVPSQRDQVARVVRCVGPSRSSTLVLSSFGGVDSIGVSEAPRKTD